MWDIYKLGLVGAQPLKVKSKVGIVVKVVF